MITPVVSYDSSYQNLTPEVFRVFMLFYLFVVQYVTLTLFCLSVMVSTVAADLQNILMGTAT
jgi:steroid 5-alpha reductase family enzyme